MKFLFRASALAQQPVANPTELDGDDVRLAKAVPGIDVVIGGHSHTELQEAIIVNGRTPVVQTGKEGENLGELVVSIDGNTLTVESYSAPPDRRHHTRRPRRQR